MVDLLRSGSEWLEQQRTAYMTSLVEYRRGEDSCELNATYGRTEYEVEDDYGIKVGAQVVDFLILAEAFSPTFDRPEAGDVIVADGVVYEVMSLTGQGHYRWSDPYRTTMRIHTKEIG